MIREGKKINARVLLELKRWWQNRFKWHVKYISFYDISITDKTGRGGAKTCNWWFEIWMYFFTKKISDVYFYIVHESQ